MFTPQGLPDIGGAGTGKTSMSPHIAGQDSPFLPGRVVGTQPLGHTAGIQASLCDKLSGLEFGKDYAIHIGSVVFSVISMGIPDASFEPCRG